MNKSIVATAFALGAIAVVWMAMTFVGSNSFALTITLVIGAVYLLGFYEMRQYRHATATLSAALNSLQSPPVALSNWLQLLHPTLRNAVQTRVEGERVALPAPVLTPYLVGLLVMLGLLGTFVGMVSTLQGAVAALQGTTELQAIREGLAAPIQGLSLAFGTSVAGVSASAMLGLISTVSRRERMLETHRLDQQIAGALREYSLVYNRQQTYKALQNQATALPEAATQLCALAEKLEQLGNQLGDTLSDTQSRFMQSVEARFTKLAENVEQSLASGISETGRSAAEKIAPIVGSAMGDIVETISVSAQSTQQTLLANNERQLAQLDAQIQRLTERWLQQRGEFDAERLQQQHTHLQELQQRASSHQSGLLEEFKAEITTTAQHQQTQTASLLAEIERLTTASDQLMQARATSEAQWLSQQAEKMDLLTKALQEGLRDLHNAEQRRGDAAIARLAELEATVSEHLRRLGAGLEAPMTRLIETASETPKAAAEVISQLREEISSNLERDAESLRERKDLMERLQSLTESIEHSSENHSELLQQMVTQSTQALVAVNERFHDTVTTEVDKLTSSAAQIAGGAIEIASLGDAFAAAVQQFSEGSTALVDTLARIEHTLEQAGVRSDEQLGYYVAQAREIIDHSIHSQRALIDELRQRHQQETLFADAN